MSEKERGREGARAGEDGCWGWGGERRQARAEKETREGREANEGERASEREKGGKLPTRTDVDFFHPGVDYGLLGGRAAGVLGGLLVASRRGRGRRGGRAGESRLVTELRGFLGEVVASGRRSMAPLMRRGVAGTLEAGAAVLALGVAGSLWRWRRRRRWRVQVLVVMLETGLPGPAVIFRTVVWDVIILRIFFAWRKFRIDVVRVHQIRAHDH